MPPKRDPALETQALEWVQHNYGKPIDLKSGIENVLKDGIILCDMMNNLMPGCIKKIDRKGGGFALMQNLGRFQDAAKKYGVPAEEVFQTVDLWEKKNICQVTLCIHALARVAQTRDDYKGMILGPKMAEKQEREFTEEQLREGRNVISLQYGSNEGASQAGLNMGKPRSIMD
ncbi:myophilin-like [Mizuhopecten yessoensis]|uniref:Myophilin n=2 Tax=Mizuhopecten yessoensis TaxID=6573 RepID=A0A210QW64_MIZYE|nr:myophilin-like [Mizuhopecten yessoensis]OWF52965.1 Myophilin [Mizuhopecten yessoensis]